MHSDGDFLSVEMWMCKLKITRRYAVSGRVLIYDRVVWEILYNSTYLERQLICDKLRKFNHWYNYCFDVNFSMYCRSALNMYMLYYKQINIILVFNCILIAAIFRISLQYIILRYIFNNSLDLLLHFHIKLKSCIQYLFKNISITKKITSKYWN